jgi:CheY-like chemotaxis protein
VKGPSLLLVDDNPDDIELTLRVFRRHRIIHDVRVARDGVEAREALQGPERPALVLLDLKMPRLDGIDLLRSIRQTPATRALPVVILTSSREERDIATCYDLGANSYLQKPVDASEFEETVRTLGQYWLTLNVPRRP